MTAEVSDWKLRAVFGADEASAIFEMLQREMKLPIMPQQLRDKLYLIEPFYKALAQFMVEIRQEANEVRP